MNFPPQLHGNKNFNLGSLPMRLKRVVLVLCLGVATFYALLVSSRSTYTDFSPDLWATRTVDQPVFPFTHILVKAPTINEWHQSDTIRWLIGKGFLTINPKSPPTFYATSEFAARKGGKAECRRLVEIISDPLWVDWSRKNPEVARDFWSSLERHLRSKSPYRAARSADSVITSFAHARDDVSVMQGLLAKGWE